MKSIFKLLALAIIIAMGVTGKTYAQFDPRFGVKAGVNLMSLGSTQINNTSVSYGYRPGFQGGIFLETPFDQTTSLTIQVLYSQKGGNLNSTINNTLYKRDVTLNYLDVPFILGVKVAPSLTLFGGIQGSLLLSKKTVATTGSAATTTSTSKTGTRKAQVGGNLGVGYAITKDIDINANYVFDFKSANKGTAYDKGEKNRGFAFTLGYKF